MTRMTLGWHIYLASIDHTAFMCRVNEHTLQIQILLNVVFLAGMKHCSIWSTVLCKVTEKHILFLKFCLQWQEKPRLDEMGRRFSGSVVNIKTFPAFFSFRACASGLLLQNWFTWTGATSQFLPQSVVLQVWTPFESNLVGKCSAALLIR